MSGLAPWAKTVVAVLGAVAVAVKEAAIVLPASVDTAVTIVIAVATALGVYAVENKPRPKPGAHAVEEG